MDTDMGIIDERLAGIHAPRQRRVLDRGQKDSIYSILWAWIVTLPATAIVSAASLRLLTV